jgi:hypothetical protein
MSRARGVDVITGKGLAEALSGVECIVDTATGPSPDEHAAREFFTTAERGAPQRIEEASDPDDPDRELLATDGLLPGGHATLAGPSFEEWLATSQ